MPNWGVPEISFRLLTRWLRPCQENRMDISLSRRRWLQSTFSMFSGIGAAVVSSRCPRSAFAADPIERSGEPYLKLSLAAYSFNSQLSPAGTDNAAAAMDLFDFIQFCADL